jgi:hypothetical protein
MLRLDRTAGCVVGHSHYFFFGLVYKISERANFSRTGLRVNRTERAGAAGPGGPTELAMDALGSSWAGAVRREPKPHRSRTEPVRAWTWATAKVGRFGCHYLVALTTTTSCAMMPYSGHGWVVTIAPAAVTAILM